MNDDFEIEILDDEEEIVVVEAEEEETEETVEENAEEATEVPDGVQLPLNFLTIGEVERDDVRVYIKQDVYKALEKLAASDTEHELGSILLGEYCEEQGRTHVIISEYVEAKYTDASSATLTFTHETWEYVHAEHEEKYPDLKIIGWQHTHPNYGIFLSNYDMFIQENFFNLPFQIAYVIDPVQGLRGFFQWKDEKVEKLTGYYIYDEVGTTIKIDQPKAKKKDTTVAVAKSSRGVNVLLTLLTIVVLCLSVAVFSLSQKYEDQVKKCEELTAGMSSYEQALFNQQMTIYNLQSVVNGQGATIQNQATELEQLRNAQNGTVRFVSYTVAAGDNLSKICTANGVDYAANYRIILAVNGIDDPNQIYVGQTVLLPVAN